MYVSSFYTRVLCAGMTMNSHNDCVDIENYLLSRLEKNSPAVKLKTLRTIKHLCQSGRPQFKIDLQRNIGAVRACTSYKGPPDPLRGDLPSEKVREAAKDTINAIFDTSTIKHNTAGRISGQAGGAAQSGGGAAPAAGAQSNNFAPSQGSSSFRPSPAATRPYDADNPPKLGMC